MKQTAPPVRPVYKIDRDSDRYRVCPNCNKEFMAWHRTQKHCKDECADEFGNLKKKREKEAFLEMAFSKPYIEPPPLLPVITTPVAPLALPIVDKAAQNIKLLDALSVDSHKGTTYQVDWLAGQGYDFGTFTSRGILHNIDPAKNCHFVQMGSYRLYRVEYSTILITKTPNNSKS